MHPLGVESISHSPLAFPKVSPPGLQSRKSWGLTSPSLGPQLSALSPCSQGRTSATCSLPSLCLALNSAASLPLPRLVVPTFNCGLWNVFSAGLPALLINSCSVCLLSHFSRVQLFATPSTVARQAPLSMGFSRRESWSGLPFPSPGDLPKPGIQFFCK